MTAKQKKTKKGENNLPNKTDNNKESCFFCLYPVTSANVCVYMCVCGGGCLRDIISAWVLAQVCVGDRECVCESISQVTVVLRKAWASKKNHLLNY